MIFAQIKDNVIINTIVLEDYSLLKYFKNDPITGEPFDWIAQVDATYPQPGVGWAFDGVKFNPPEEPTMIEEEE